MPPVMDMTGTCSPTLSASHRDDGAGSVDPVTPIARSADRSWSRRGTTPALMQASTYPGLVPRTVTRSCAAISHNRSTRGCDGLPS